jgi:Uma2 family endonuclease
MEGMTAQAAVEVCRHLFTVDDYYRMAETGILRPDERVELIEGEIIEVPPIGSVHADIVDRLLAVMVRKFYPGLAIVRAQNAVRLDQHSEPQPDVCLLKPRADFYSSGHPSPEDVLLLVEVADTTLSFDRAVKLRLYARSGIAEFWLVDLHAATIEVYSSPVGEAYASQRLIQHGAEVAPRAFPGVPLAVDDILGPLPAEA